MRTRINILDDFRPCTRPGTHTRPFSPLVLAHTLFTVTNFLAVIRSNRVLVKLERNEHYCDIKTCHNNRRLLLNCSEIYFPVHSIIIDALLIANDIPRCRKYGSIGKLLKYDWKEMLILNLQKNLQKTSIIYGLWIIYF